MQGLATQFIIENELNTGRGDILPAIQPTDYQPKLSDKVSFAISDDSLKMLDGSTVAACLDGSMETTYGENLVTIHKLKQGVRFVILSPTDIYAETKDGKVSPLIKGEKLGGPTGRKTVAKILMAMIDPTGIPVTDADGKVQVFTFKLNSYKTGLIGKPYPPKTPEEIEADKGTIYALNRALQAHYSKDDPRVKAAWLTRLVSVGLVVTPKKETSKAGESSMGVRYAFDGQAKPLDAKAAEMIHQLVTTPEFTELAKDPFGLNRGQNTTAQAAPTLDDSAIAF